jgi:hypothetical protein
MFNINLNIPETQARELLQALYVYLRVAPEVETDQHVSSLEEIKRQLETKLEQLPHNEQDL